jgi:hypothetical protein
MAKRVHNMAKYFNYFPKTPYYKSKDSTSLDVVTNITTRFNFDNRFRQNAATYYKYKIREGETPEILASKIYGSPEKHWVILSLNNIVDPIFEWPLPNRSFGKFIESKYKASASANQTGLEWATANVYGYYKVVTRSNPNTGVINVNRIKLDANTYNSTTQTTTNYTLEDGTSLIVAITKESKTYYEYEQEINENKRLISILKPEFVTELESELIAVMKDSIA